MIRIIAIALIFSIQSPTPILMSVQLNIIRGVNDANIQTAAWL